MWKIFFEYSDGGKITVTGKGKSITLDRAELYHRTYGVGADKATYQQYPKKDNKPVELLEKIKQLKCGAE